MLNPEHVLIPFEASALPPGPWLVFAPHGDDETYGMGGALIKAADEGIETHLIVLTDGALGGDKENLVDLRHQEVSAACELLGIKSYQNWQEPDRGLHNSIALADKAVAAIKELGAASVFFPGPLELHPDHREAAEIVWSAVQSMLNNDGVCPAAYSCEIGVQNPVNVFVDVTEQRARKEQAMAVYASQNDENNYEELVLSLDKGRTFTLPADVSHAEGFYHYSEQQLRLTRREVTHQIIDLYF